MFKASIWCKKLSFLALLVGWLIGLGAAFAQIQPLSDRAIKHIFEGDVKTKKGRVQANGCHHMLAITSNKARIVNGTLLKGPNELLKAKIEIYDVLNKRWVAKVSNSGYSTIFPQSWTKAKTISEILYAYEHRNKVSGGYNEYYGMSQNGLIEIRMYLNTQQEIISAFPKDWTK